ncbi:MAG: PspC family transcriptional regulator [Mucilaginibacter polytrichastri]|nr:PspC family transcriptional regulator [Mucilaginibacter polytrichastri]
MIQRIFVFFERNSFGVCTYLGERLNVSIAKLRLFFIYVSFISVGLPILVYIFAGFVLDFRNYVKRRRSRVFDI